MVQFWEGRRHARCCANDRVMVQTVQNCGVPQLHCSDKFVDVPAVAVHRRLEVPVIMQRRSLAVGGASDSAHRRSQRTIQLQQETDTLSAWVTAILRVVVELSVWIYTLPRLSRLENNHNNHNNQAYYSCTAFPFCVTVMIPNPADGSRAERVSTGSARRRERATAPLHVAA